jgi:hypothetical protein
MEAEIAGFGFKVENDSVEVDVGGLGVKAGKEVGIETPFGGASVDLEKINDALNE